MLVVLAVTTELGKTVPYIHDPVGEIILA